MFATVFMLPTTPTHAQTRVFVAAQGSDSNPCTFALPCRTFQNAHDTVAAGGEIDVLDPAGYGPVNITKSISIQGHGFSGITAARGPAITINAPEDAIVNLSGLLLEGSGTSTFGIAVETAGFVTISNAVIRRFSSGLGGGLRNQSHSITMNVSDTTVANNVANGVLLQPIQNGGEVSASFVRVQAFGNGRDGFFIDNEFAGTVAVVDLVDCIAVGAGDGIPPVAPHAPGATR
jgi:hypothetical protein